MDFSIVVGLAVTCALMLLLSLGLKAAVKKFFGREISYFASFFVVLGISMVFSLADNQFHLLSPISRRVAVWWVTVHSTRPAAAPEAHAH